MIEQLRNTARQLLQEGKVAVVIGYGRDEKMSRTYPAFVTAADGVDELIFDETCTFNLATYLNRAEVKALGKPAVVLKPVDARAAVVLRQESQFSADDVVLIGMATGEEDANLADLVDIVIGEPSGQTPPAEERYARLNEFMKKSPEERMAYWREELGRCIKCYACRQVCPLCYCRVCIVDKNRPVEIVTSSTPRGNFAWNIARAFHLAGRCVGCGQCTAACPAGIDLALLNMAMAQAAEEEFDYRAGVDPQAEPIIGSYAEADKEEFIG